ncbi:MAG: restriction endonuclease [Microbacter sp.]
MKSDYSNLHIIVRRQEYTRSHNIRFVADIQHVGLRTIRVINETNPYILGIKVEEQFNKWDEQWDKKIQKDKLQAHKEASLNLAEERSFDAQFQLEQIENILTHSLKIDNTIDWESLKDKQMFNIPNPKRELDKELSKIEKPNTPVYRLIPDEPQRDSFVTKLTLIDKLSKSRTQRKKELAESLFLKEISNWKDNVAEIEQDKEKLNQEYQEQLKKVEIQTAQIKAHYDELEENWEKTERDFYEAQEVQNAKVELKKTSYFEHNIESVIEYCELILNNSQYPDFFPRDFDLDYNKTTKLLLVEYCLPDPESFPRLFDVKYIATKKELKESYLSDSQIAKIYDSAVYKILLRTLHELFEADQANAIDLVVLNGWVKTINKGTGKKVNNCIVSIQVKKDEFVDIELSQVDTKTCFKNLKGIGSSKLSGITAIQPILQINKNDKRFISSYDVVSSVNKGVNLALMDWEDFEHLIREIFEKEFSTNGGEIKVTQASRDGGVDAVAFDPDPIRGGKIVIQAKRYTNTVGVSAVRDLYGTVMNEGATKGILVTTADYGPDAYEFAKNKPITLMNGSNLLYLLEKHGNKARIDIKEAKKFLNGE